MSKDNFSLQPYHSLGNNGVEIKYNLNENNSVSVGADYQEPKTVNVTGAYEHRFDSAHAAYIRASKNTGEVGWKINCTIFAVKDIIYDNQILNHQSAFNYISTKLGSASDALDIGTRIDQEILCSGDHELIDAAMLSLDLPS